MGANPPVYSSVSGPAKWAAVIILTAASSAGLTYSLTREPRSARADAPVVYQAPPRAPEPQVKPRAAPMAPEKPQAPQPQQASPTPEAAPAEAEPPPAPEVVTPDPEPQPPTPAAPAYSRLININAASAAQLELLPQIGPALAKRIIDHRNLHGPFRSIKDLDNVKGIGPKILEKVAPLITVE